MSEHKSITLHDGTLFEYDITLKIADMVRNQAYIQACAFRGRRVILELVRQRDYECTGYILPVSGEDAMVTNLDAIVYVKLCDIEQRIQQYTQVLRDSYNAVLALDAPVRTGEKSVRMDN